MKKITRTSSALLLSCLSLLSGCYGAPTPRGITNSIKLSAEQGDANAQYEVGRAAHHGRGVPRNGEVALKWYRMAAGQGDAKAQYSLGILSHEGFGIRADCSEARKWFMTAAENLRTAAERGDMYAQYLLGYAYEYGRGVTTDHKEALKWYQKAAEQGYTGLDYKLAWLRCGARRC